MMRFAALLPGLVRLLVACATAFLPPAWGQVLPVVKGEAVLATPKSAMPAGLLTTEEEMPAHRVLLVPPTSGELRALAARPSLAKRTAIGFGRDVAEFAETGFGPGLVWSRVGEWRIAKMRVQSPGAAALRVGLRVSATREPWELRVAGSDDESKAIGPVRQGSPVGAAAMFWTPLTEGDAQVIEIASPASEPQPSVEIVRLSHLVSGPSTRFAKTVADIGSAGSCEIDVACVANPSQALLDAAKAVVEIAFTRSTGGTYLCSGTILNDTDASTQFPYLFTANHCFESDSAPYNTPTQMQAVANTLNSYFFFDAVACGSKVTPNYVQLTGGAAYLYNNLAQDVLFLKLNEALPAGAFLSGWDPNAVPDGAAVTVLHHPQGDLKKFSTGTVSGLTTLASPNDASTGYWRVTYGQGTTEGGSSGSGLLTAATGEYLLRGGLWGGAASCSTLTSPDYYSRFDAAYPSLRPWLSPSGTPGFDTTDLWWNAAESGWGINLTQHASGQIFAVWYTYGADARSLLARDGGRGVGEQPDLLGASLRHERPGLYGLLRSERRHAPRRGHDHVQFHRREQRHLHLDGERRDGHQGHHPPAVLRRPAARA